MWTSDVAGKSWTVSVAVVAVVTATLARALQHAVAAAVVEGEGKTRPREVVWQVWRDFRVAEETECARVAAGAPARGFWEEEEVVVETATLAPVAMMSVRAIPSVSQMVSAEVWAQCKQIHGARMKSWGAVTLVVAALVMSRPSSSAHRHQQQHHHRHRHHHHHLLEYQAKMRTRHRDARSASEEPWSATWEPSATHQQQTRSAMSQVSLLA